jgi:Transposase and inactivated derivatives
LIRGLLTDEEWSFFEPFVVSVSPLGGRPAGDHRRVLDGVFWIARTGAPWRDLPAELGNWNSVFRQFRRWTASGLWDVMLEALADGGGEADLLQMIDSTIVRAHHCAAGGRGGLAAMVLAARAVASRASSTSAATRTACPSPCT